MKILFLLIFAFVTFSISTEKATECSNANPFDDDHGIHNRLVIIKGKVIEMNNLDLGQTPAHTGTTIIFQKDGCRTCLVSTNPDIEGNYEIRVGRGKYRLVVTSPSPPEYDLLAPGQQRYIDTKNVASQVTRFDIKLNLPSGK